MSARDLSKSLQRTLTHLRPPPRKGGKFAMPIPTHFRGQPKFVQVKDRIPFWHIAPNDKVVVVRGPSDVKGQLGTVERVEREHNLVYLKEQQFAAKKRQPSEYPGQALSPNYSGGDAAAVYYTAKPYHISNVRLQVEDAGEKYTVTRMKRGKVSWDSKLRRFTWNRYGLVTALATETSKGWVKIPWPKEEQVKADPVFGKQGPLDATAVESFKSTWRPTLSAVQKLKPNRQVPYLAAQDSPVPELQVPSIELQGQWNSRANRTQRFNEQKQQQQGQGAVKRVSSAILQKIKSGRTATVPAPADLL
ncbi:hypothetical protein OIV83_000310 [Microbotryomycetes sp. JL201]|nr:hypothetical protein OIV83_000310 [Microbotryomycetes sp. JL201]